MYSQAQLDIIRMFGKKELSEGCLIKKNGEYYKAPGKILKYDGRQVKILGHIPHLEDVLIKLKKSLYDFRLNLDEGTIAYVAISDGEKTKYILYDLTLPLLEQDENTLIELLKLFK